jgi:uncharacterized protein YacL
MRLHDPEAPTQDIAAGESTIKFILGIIVRLVVAFLVVWLYSEIMNVTVRRTAHFALEEMRTDDPVLRRYSMVVLGWGQWGVVQGALLAAVLAYVGARKRPILSTIVMFIVCAVWSSFWIAAFTFR